MACDLLVLRTAIRKSSENVRESQESISGPGEHVLSAWLMHFQDLSRNIGYYKLNAMLFITIQNDLHGHTFDEYTQLSPCRHLGITDTPLIRTAAKLSIDV